MAPSTTGFALQVGKLTEWMLFASEMFLKFGVYCFSLNREGKLLTFPHG
jgi:hypothetical protein